MGIQQTFKLILTAVGSDSRHFDKELLYYFGTWCSDGLSLCDSKVCDESSDMNVYLI